MKWIWLLIPVLCFATEVILDPYEDLDYDEISVYEIHAPNEEKDPDCVCNCDNYSHLLKYLKE